MEGMKRLCHLRRRIVALLICRLPERSDPAVLARGHTGNSASKKWHGGEAFPKTSKFYEKPLYNASRFFNNSTNFRIRNMLDNETFEEVCTGEVRSAGRRITLVSNAIGSCIAVMIVDHERGTGGIAHVMLPGGAESSRSEHPLRYAENAIDELLRQMKRLGSTDAGLIAVLAGGGNVLQRPDDTICSMNIRSVLGILARRGIPIAASSLGGTERRKVRLEIATCSVFQSLGDAGEEVLWQPVRGRMLQH